MIIYSLYNLLNYLFQYIGTSYDLWIILEYCINGDLRSFLQHGRNRYDENETSLAVDLSVTFGPRNLIHIALQIAKGMEFLISRKVNVL